MNDGCNRCGKSTKLLEREAHSQILLDEVAALHNKQSPIWRRLGHIGFGPNYHEHIQNLSTLFTKLNKTRSQATGEYSLRSMLPPDDAIFLLFNRVKEMERTEGNSLAHRLNLLYELADSKRKFSKETRDWMKNKSPFLNSDFKDNWKSSANKNRLGGSMPFITKNIAPQLEENCIKTDVICLECGTIVRSYFDIKKKGQNIVDLLSTLPTIKTKLEAYDKAMAKWKQADENKKAKKQKERLEKKRLDNIAKLEAEQKKVEKELRKLKGQNKPSGPDTQVYE
jgi:hypothetical protein